MENSPKCLHCSNLITHDIGYSEYTVTGSEFKCKMEKFKDWEYSDELGNENLSLKNLSEKCTEYKEGSPEEHHIDCDINNTECDCEKNL